MSLVIFTVVDSALHDPAGDWRSRARPVVEMLFASRIPVIFVSDAPPDELAALQQSLDVRHPFVARGGAELHLPRGYFSDLLETMATAGAWDVLRLRPRGGAADAIRLLMSLYRFRDDPILFVGLGEAWKDRALLRAVDVPVIVRNDAVDQARLARQLPDAYLTAESGPAGWNEAILGSAGV